jgi:DNA oxidative demethylase
MAVSSPVGTQGNLFGAANAQVDGLLLLSEAVTPAEEEVLAAHIDAAPLTPFQFGQRLTTHFGSGYDSSRGRIAPAPPLPDWLIALRARLAPLTGLEPNALVQALLLRYNPGAGIGWHRDRPQYGDVLGLSLSTDCVLRLRRRTESGFQRRSISLPARSLYLLSGEVRWRWEHSIAPMDRVRRSITFRTLR